MDEATQLTMFCPSRGLTCLICQQPGAQVPCNLTLARTWVWRGEQKHVVVYGFRHPACDPKDATQWETLTPAPPTASGCANADASPASP